MKKIIATLNESLYEWSEKSEQSYDDFISGVKKYSDELKAYAEAQNKKSIEAGEKPKYDIKKITEIKIKESSVDVPITAEEHSLLRQKKLDELRKKLKATDLDNVKELQKAIFKIIEIL